MGNQSYKSYRKNMLQKLVNQVNNSIGKTDCYILPLVGETNTDENRCKTIFNVLGFNTHENIMKGKAKGIKTHGMIHHLNSSQLLCLMFFGELVDKKGCGTQGLNDILDKLNICESASPFMCEFEYSDKMKCYIDGKQELEGTRFDFHVKNRVQEVFFEIKFTESGFGSVKMNNRYNQKVEFYYEKLKSNNNAVHIFKGDVIPTKEQIRRNYQIIRNLSRIDSPNKKIVFITDGNNPQTATEIERVKSLLDSDNKYVAFKTWQEIANLLRGSHLLPFQIKVMDDKQ
jgi:hypothetical protein